MRRGRTLTKHLNLETRQHDLLGRDLGEGLPRRQLGFGLAVYVMWTLLLAPIVGIPSPGELAIYILPPGFMTYYGWQWGQQHSERRRRLTEWAILLRYAVVGHRPVICLGSRAATKAEYVPFSERIPGWVALRGLFETERRPSWDRDEQTAHSADQPADAPTTVNMTALLVDAAQVEKARERAISRLRTKSLAQPAQAGGDRR